METCVSHVLNLEVKPAQPEADLTCSRHTELVSNFSTSSFCIELWAFFVSGEKGQTLKCCPF